MNLAANKQPHSFLVHPKTSAQSKGCRVRRVWGRAEANNPTDGHHCGERGMWADLLLREPWYGGGGLGNQKDRRAP